jgi:hypothetical protein
MAASAYQTAVLELDGALGAADETLQILQHLALDEASTAGTAEDASNANRDGTYINSPTANASGPLMPETETGRSITVNGTTQLVNGGLAADLFTAMTNEGLTFMAWMKNTDTANAQHFFGFRIGGDKGFVVGYNLNSLGNYASDPDGAGPFGDGNTIGCIVAAAGYTRYHGTQWQAPAEDTRFSDGLWHLVEVFVKVTGTGNPTFRCFVDSVQQTNTNDQNVGTILTSDLIGNGTSRFGIGGSYSNTTPFAYGRCSIAQSTIIRGSLTTAQRRAIYKAASYQVRGLPVRTAHYHANYSWAGAVGGSQAGVGDTVQELEDLTGNDNHLVAPLLENQPAFIAYEDFSVAELAFDNLYQAHLVTPRQHILLNSATTPIQPRHVGVIFVCRPQVSSVFGRSMLHAAGICTAAGASVGMLAIQCSGTYSDTLTLMDGATARGAASGMPRCRTMPGRVVLGFTCSGDATGAIRLFMNRWAANASAGLSASAAATGIHIGGTAAGTDGMWPGLFLEMIVTTPFTDDEFLAFASSAMAEVGETLYPPNHTVLQGDSIGAGEGTTNCRNFLYYLPIAARQRSSWCNSSVQNAHLDGGGENIKDRSFDDADWWDPLAMNYALQQGGVNDANSADTGANMAADADSIWSDSQNGGAERQVIMGLGINASATPRNAYNALQAAKVPSPVYRYVAPADLTGTLPDGLHPDDEGAERMGDALWDDWGMGSLPLAGGRGGQRLVRPFARGRRA